MQNKSKEYKKKHLRIRNLNGEKDRSETREVVSKGKTLNRIESERTVRINSLQYAD